MATKDENLDRLWDFLLNYPTDFMLAFGKNDEETSSNLVLKMAWSRRAATKEEYSRLASKYDKFATLCYVRQSNAVLEKSMHSRHRTSIASEEAGDKTMGLSDYRRWHLFIADGAIRKAGYAVVARIHSREERSVRNLIREMQITFTGERFFLRPSTHLHLLLKSLGMRGKAA